MRCWTIRTPVEIITQPGAMQTNRLCKKSWFKQGILFLAPTSGLGAKPWHDVDKQVLGLGQKVSHDREPLDCGLCKHVSCNALAKPLYHQRYTFTSPIVYFFAWYRKQNHNFCKKLYDCNRWIVSFYCGHSYATFTEIIFGYASAISWCG